MKRVVFLFCLVLSINAQGQDDLLDSLEASMPANKTIVLSTFKGTRLINLHTVETLGKGSLDFRISHRFGDFSTGFDNLWGLDGPAAIKFGFDYSITDRLVIGIGRSSYGKLYDGYVKYKILNQTTGNEIPVSVVGVASINIAAARGAGVQYPKNSHRLSYFYQLLIARKFNSKLSLQLSPMMIHYNLVESEEYKNDIFAIAASGRYKFSRSFAFTGEYIYTLNNYTSFNDLYHNSASVGIDIETGGHVFQLFVTNSFAINEVQLVPYTAGAWSKGEIRLGFNVSRVFGLTKHAKEQKANRKKNKQW